MRCPNCQSNIQLSFHMYLRAPTGKFSCPHCKEKLRFEKEWYYWLVELIGILIGVITGFSVGFHFDGFLGAIFIAAIFGFLTALPIDWFLSSRFAYTSIALIPIEKPKVYVYGLTSVLLGGLATLFFSFDVFAVNAGPGIYDVSALSCCSAMLAPVGLVFGILAFTGKNQSQRQAKTLGIFGLFWNSMLIICLVWVAAVVLSYRMLPLL